MRFGRVVGTVSPVANADAGQTGDGLLRLVVMLEDGAAVTVVRSETVTSLGDSLGAMDLAWQADQYTQETIGNELALAGWEPIGLAEPDRAEAQAPVASSPTYIVRWM